MSTPATCTSSFLLSLVNRQEAFRARKVLSYLQPCLSSNFQSVNQTVGPLTAVF